jgi:hypothetical protein
MARLTGEAARKWLAENPNKGYYDARKGTYVEPERSGVGNFLLGMSKPFRTLAAAPLEIAMDIATKARGEQSPSYKEDFVQLPFTTGTETSQIRDDPYLALAKGAAGTASYFLPGGATKGLSGLSAIGSAAGRGAVRGALGGFGYSAPGEELSSTLKGGAISGLLGGGIQGIKEAPGMLQRAGAKMEQGGLNKLSSVQQQDQALVQSSQDILDMYDDQIRMAQEMAGGTDSSYLKELQRQISEGVVGGADDILPATKNSILNLGLTKKEFSSIKGSVIENMKNRGLNVSSALEVSDNYPDFLALLQKSKEEVLQQYGNQLINASKTSRALAELPKIINDNPTTRLLDTRIGEIFGNKTTLNNIPKQMTVAQQTALKELLDEIGGGYLRTMSGDATAQVTAQLAKRARDISREALTGTKELDQVLNQYSDALKLKKVSLEAPYISEDLAQRQGQTIGTLQQKAAMESRRLGERGVSLAQSSQDRLGRLVEKRARAAQGLTQLKDTLATQNQISVGLDGIMPIHTSSFPVGGDVRAPLASVKAGLGQAMQNIPDISSGLEKTLGLGQRAIPGVVGMASQMGQEPQEQYQPTEQFDIGDISGLGQGSYGVREALADAYQIMPTASESEAMSLARMLLSEQVGTAPQATAQNISNAKSALDSLAKLEALLKKKPELLKTQVLGKGNVASIVGGKDYQNYQSWAYNLADLLLRMRTGAQANETEIKLYMNELMPKWYESEEARQAKLDQIRVAFQNVLQGQRGYSEQGPISDYYINY